MVDFAGVVEVVGDQDADEGARGQALAPVSEALAFQLGVVLEGANGRQPPAVSLRQFPIRFKLPLRLYRSHFPVPTAVRRLTRRTGDKKSNRQPALNPTPPAIKVARSPSVLPR